MSDFIAPVVFALTFVIGGIVLKRIAYNNKMEMELLNLQIAIALIELELSEKQ